MVDDKSKDAFFGSHELQVRTEDVRSSSDRSFGLVFAIVFALIGAWAAYAGSSAAPWWLGVAVLFAFLAVAFPKTLAPLNRMWLKLGLLLFKVISPLTMGVVFYLCVLPIGALLRVFGKDLLRTKWDSSADSYWIRRTPPGPAPESLDKQF